MGLLLGAFIVILVGVVLINSIADSVSELDDILTLPVNQTFAWPDNNTKVDYDDADAIPSTVVLYGNVTKMGLDVNYTVDDYGVFILNQTAGGGNSVFDLLIYNMTYDHEGDNYVDDSTSRNLISLVVLFFALAILGVGYLIVVKAYNNMNF